MANRNEQQTPPCDSCNEKITELEHTLHQQFAENYNNISGSLMAFVAAMFIVFTGYAYVFSNIKGAPCIFNCLFKSTEGTYSINALFWANLMLNLTMLVIFYFSVNLGLTQRKEQFITYTIRRNAYGVISNSVYELNTNIFPKGYHPFRKTPYNYLVGIYGYIAKCAYKMSCVISWITFIFMFCYLLKGIFCNEYEKNKLCCFIIQTIVLIIIHILSIFAFLQQKENIEKKGFKKYQEYEKEYKAKLDIKD